MSPSLVDVRLWLTEYIMGIFLVLGILGNIINIYNNQFYRIDKTLWNFVSLETNFKLKKNQTVHSLDQGQEQMNENKSKSKSSIS